jgi:hypothetical protein
MVNSFVSRDDLLKEMTVVRNEFEMGENSPDRILSRGGVFADLDRRMHIVFEVTNMLKV